MSQTILELLNDLFNRWCGENIISINKLPASGSPREYYRITGTKRTAIGAINHDREENEAFIEFSSHFHSIGLAVPEIYLVDLEHNAYLQEDLGDLDPLRLCIPGKRQWKFSGVIDPKFTNRY